VSLAEMKEKIKNSSADLTRWNYFNHFIVLVT
jgi:hypothetical protein